MVLLPENEQTTIAAIERAVVAQADDGMRPHLGASLIGRPCDREIWYSWRWAERRVFSGRMLRLFARGHREEQALADLLHQAGVTVVTVDPETGKQYSFAELGGHFGGSTDGAGKGFLEARKTWHVLEFKTANDKSFQELKKKGVKEAKPEHWAQLQMYMKWTGLERAYYLAVNKNDDDLHGERVRYDREAAEQLTERAQRIIAAEAPPPRISDDAAWYQCKLCSYHAICHAEKLPQVNCRTCLHATPEPQGDCRWSCAQWRSDVPLDAQKQGCEEHRYIPALIPFAQVVDASGGQNWVEYALPDGRRFRNGPKGTASYPSAELRALPPALIGNADVDSIREKFDGRAAAPIG